MTPPLNVQQVDLIAQAREALLEYAPERERDLIDALGDIMEEFWGGYEPTDAEIYRMAGGVLKGEAA